MKRNEPSPTLEYATPRPKPTAPGAAVAFLVVSLIVQPMCCLGGLLSRVVPVIPPPPWEGNLLPWQVSMRWAERLSALSSLLTLALPSFATIGGAYLLASWLRRNRADKSGDGLCRWAAYLALGWFFLLCVAVNNAEY